MSLRINPSHTIFLALVLAFTIAMNYSAITAKFALNNLIILAPASGLSMILIGVIFFTGSDAENPPEGGLRKMFGDLLLLGLFCSFCGMMFLVGADVATFFFVWLGIILCGERSFWKPPLFALVFAIAVTTSFSTLFPFPIETLLF
jgi:hypothetical protein